jgi:hypothetical protein
MSMRTLIGTSLVAMLAGCGGAVVPGAADDTGSSESALLRRCPDPQTDCTMSNGTGVYTAEDGYAGIDSYQLMITHFINHGSYVTFQGRYFDASLTEWFALPNPGSIYYANYNGKKNLLVTGVSESYTIPTWTLFDNSTSTTITVTGAQLLDLQLYITLANPINSKTELYMIDFDSVATDVGKGAVRKFNMRWRPATANALPTQYCVDANNQPDQVVFQQGMYVNPVTAMVVRNSNTAGFVTLSCRLGAMATVHWWGYAYRLGFNTFYFDSGLHMKRASYCADAHHYTKAGTLIQIQDNQGIQNDQIDHLEAYWSPTGAKCLDTMRHPGMGFNRMCNGVLLPHCSQIAVGPQYLADGPAVLQP